MWGRIAPTDVGGYNDVADRKMAALVAGRDKFLGK
jgi:hypothetical protein